MKRTIHSLEEELSDATKVAMETRTAQNEWKTERYVVVVIAWSWSCAGHYRTTLMKDLDTAETKLDDLYQKLKLEAEGR